jgi:two-component system NarL family sensor kinase
MGRHGASPATTDTTDHDQLRRRNRELSVLNAIAEGLNRAVDLHAALSNALALVADLLGLRAGWVWLLDEDTDEPELAAAQHLPPALRDHPEAMQGSCYCLDSFQAGDMHGAANVNVVSCTRLWRAVRDTEGLQYHASIPLYAGDKKLGVLNVAGEDWHEIGPDELRLLYTIGYQIGIAVERARLHARAADLATVDERTRIARELHDSLAQSLAAIALQLEAADALTGGSDPRIRETVREALRQTRETIRETRAVVHDLRAGALEGRTLPEALRGLAASYRRSYGIRISVTVTGADACLTPHGEAGVFRIAQEALTNVVKHAGATRVWLRLHAGATSVKLAVKDNGHGFDPERPPPRAGHGGFGLTGMSERARLLGGSLRVESAPGAGTRIEAIIPRPGGSS